MKTPLALLLAVVLTAAAHAAEGYFVAGESVTVTVTVATGTAPFTYQWRKNSVDIPGATAQDYVIKAISATDAGLYSVRVANKAGETISDNAAANIIVKAGGVVTGFKTGSVGASPTSG